MVSTSPYLKFWITTSHCRARSRTICWPSGVFRSTVTERLLRFTLLKYAVSVSPMRRPQSRVSSPRLGCSTLITSAPKSPSTMPHQGPASTRERSSTRMPASGSPEGEAVMGLVSVKSLWSAGLAQFHEVGFALVEEGTDALQRFCATLGPHHVLGLQIELLFERGLGCGAAQGLDRGIGLQRPVGHLAGQVHGLGQRIARVGEAVDRAQGMQALARDALTGQTQLGQHLARHELGQEGSGAAVRCEPHLDIGHRVEGIAGADQQVAG